MDPIPGKLYRKKHDSICQGKIIKRGTILIFVEKKEVLFDYYSQSHLNTCLEFHFLDTDGDIVIFRYPKKFGSDYIKEALERGFKLIQ